MASASPMTWPAAGRRWCCSTPASSTGGCGTTSSAAHRPGHRHPLRRARLRRVVAATGRRVRALGRPVRGDGRGRRGEGAPGRRLAGRRDCPRRDAHRARPRRSSPAVRRRHARLAVARRAERALEAEVEAWERGDLDGCAEESMVTWFDGPQRLAIEVDPTVRRRAWEMQRLAIDLENDDATARAPEPPSSERLGEVRAPTLVAVGELDQPDMVDIAGAAGGGHPRRQARGASRGGAPAADGAAGRVRAAGPPVHRRLTHASTKRTPPGGRRRSYLVSVVAGDGFEPTTFGL